MCLFHRPKNAVGVVAFALSDAHRRAEWRARELSRLPLRQRLNRYHESCQLARLKELSMRAMHSLAARLLSFLRRLRIPPAEPKSVAHAARVRSSRQWRRGCTRAAYTTDKLPAPTSDIEKYQ